MNHHYRVDKDYLVKTPVPKQTNTYKPVSHERLINLVSEELNKAGFVIKDEIYSAARGGKQANGKYYLNYGNDSEMSLMIAWQNSYDKSQSLKFAIGTYVIICGNGLVTGDIGTFKRQHKGIIQTLATERISEYIGASSEVFEHMLKFRDHSKNVKIDPKVRAELLGRLFIEKEIINSDQLSFIKGEIKKPTYNYNSPNTFWELYNQVTFAIKEDHPSNWLTRQEKVHDFFHTLIY